jgi:hypothetical protein
MMEVSVSKLRFGVTCAALFALAAGSASAGIFDFRRRSVSPADARETLVALAEIGGQTPSIDEIRSLVEAYRLDGTPGFLPLATAPYPRFLINGKLAEIYPALYASAVKDVLGEGVPKDLDLEALYDGLLNLVAQDKVPDALKKELKQISPKMAKRALEGKSAECALDTSEKIDKPGILKLLPVKLVPNWLKACTVRKRLFNAAKDALITARNDFPKQFRKGFLEKINTTLAGFPKLVSEKFGAGEVVHPIWGDRGSILEETADSKVSGGRREISMKLFAEGLLADLYAAKALMASDKPSDRTLAAGHNYAVVNRWLLLTGGSAADWDAAKGEIPVVKTGEGMEPPKFREAAFGGWGAQMDGFSIAVTPWGDWGKYDPTSETEPTPLRIFPTRFEVDAAGVATLTDPSQAIQKTEDFALLLLSVTEFLNATQPGTAFAKYFGGADQIGDLLDPKKPMLFPTEGRLVAVGALAAVAKNLLHSQIGHVGSKPDGLRIYFRDMSTLPQLGGIRSTDIEMEKVSLLLVTAARLMRAIELDPIAASEPKLKLILPDVRNLIHIGALVIGKETQNTDGSFRSLMASADTTRSVDSQLAALRVLMTSYNDATPEGKAGAKSFTLPRIVPGLQYLFSTYLVPGATLTERQKLEARALWNECQASLRVARADLPWAAWEERIRGL